MGLLGSHGVANVASLACHSVGDGVLYVREGRGGWHDNRGWCSKRWIPGGCHQWPWSHNQLLAQDTWTHLIPSQLLVSLLETIA